MGLTLPFELVEAVVDNYQNATIQQHSTNGHMRDIGGYSYNTETQEEHKDYSTR